MERRKRATNNADELGLSRPFNCLWLDRSCRVRPPRTLSLSLSVSLTLLGFKFDKLSGIMIMMMKTTDQPRRGRKSSGMTIDHLRCLIQMMKRDSHSRYANSQMKAKFQLSSVSAASFARLVERLPTPQAIRIDQICPARPTDLLGLH